MEFKNEAANLIVDKKYTITEACNAMDVGYTAMRRWEVYPDIQTGRLGVIFT